jgi:hypothetical protein
MSTLFWKDRFYAALFIALTCVSGAMAAPKDEFLSWTAVGSAVQFQTFGISKHFKRSQAPSDQVTSQSETSFSESDVSAKAEKNLPLSWLMSVGYGHATSAPSGVDSSVSDHLLGYSVGLNWEILSNLEVSGKIGLVEVPSESYARGFSRVKVEYTHYLADNLEDVDDDDEDAESSDYDANNAREYYRHEREKKAPLNVDGKKARKKGSKLLFPQLKISYQFGAYRSHAGQRTFRLPSKSLIESVSADLYQYQDALDFSYMPNERVTLGLGVGIFRSSRNVADFLQYLEMGNALRQWNFGGPAGDTFLTQAMTFPKYMFTQSVSIKIRTDQYLKLNVTEIAYAAENQNSSIVINPILYRGLGRNWVGGFGLHGNLTSGTLSYFIGSLELSYKLQ